MKKILISLLIVLLLVLAYFTIFQGISFGDLKILSVAQIVEGNDKLTSQIEQTNAMLKKDFPSKKEMLSTEVTKLLQEKEKYFDIAKISTDGEISKANTEETYMIEYLWTRIGRHATSKGVNLKMDVMNGELGQEDIKNLEFTVKGSYVGIIDFISSIEDDSELNFRIKDFKLIPNEQNLTATFKVTNVRVKIENVTSSTTQQPDTTPQPDNSAQQNQNVVQDVNNMQNNNGTNSAL